MLQKMECADVDITVIFNLKMMIIWALVEAEVFDHQMCTDFLCFTKEQTVESHSRKKSKWRATTTK